MKMYENQPLTRRIMPSRGNGKSLLDALYTIVDIVAELKSMCPNKRVVHLSSHAKKKRIRKKNSKRWMKIVKKIKKLNE